MADRRSGEAIVSFLRRAHLEQGIPYCERHRQRAHNRPKQNEADRAQNAGRDGLHRFSPAMQTTVQRLFQVAIARRMRT
jgi:hypothetical protein